MRRVLFATLVIATIAGTLALAAYALSAGGFGALDALVLMFFGLTLPWTAIGFWDAVIGFCIMRFARDEIVAVVPAAGLVRGELEQARRRLADVYAAVTAVEAGTYGRCETCGRPIAAERLAARPAARTCIDCAR